MQDNACSCLQDNLEAFDMTCQKKHVPRILSFSLSRTPLSPEPVQWLHAAPLLQICRPGCELPLDCRCQKGKDCSRRSRLDEGAKQETASSALKATSHHGCPTCLLPAALAHLSGCAHFLVQGLKDGKTGAKHRAMPQNRAQAPRYSHA